MRAFKAYCDTGRIRSDRGPVLAVSLGRGELKDHRSLWGQGGVCGPNPDAAIRAWHGRQDCDVSEAD